MRQARGRTSPLPPGIGGVPEPGRAGCRRSRCLGFGQLVVGSASPAARRCTSPGTRCLPRLTHAALLLAAPDAAGAAFRRWPARPPPPRLGELAPRSPRPQTMTLLLVRRRSRPGRRPDVQHQPILAALLPDRNGPEVTGDVLVTSPGHHQSQPQCQPSRQCRSLFGAGTQRRRRQAAKHPQVADEVAVEGEEGGTSPRDPPPGRQDAPESGPIGDRWPVATVVVLARRSGGAPEVLALVL
jgi:hypothetical protein